MLREEAPGAQRRGSPLSWMEGERGEDRRPGAGRGGEGGRARGTPGDSGASRGGRGPSRPWARGSGATVHRVRTRAFVCFSPGNRVSAAPSPGRLFQGCCCGFRLPSAAHSAVPAGPRLLGTRGLTPPRGRNLSGLTARRAPLGCSPWACERVRCGPATPHALPAQPRPAPRSRLPGEVQSEGAAWSSGLSLACWLSGAAGGCLCSYLPVDLIEHRGVGPGLAADP